MTRFAVAAFSVTLISAVGAQAGASQATADAAAADAPVADAPVAGAAQNDPSDRLRRHKLGFALFFDNDLIGDHDDRWRTGAVSASYVRGYEWTGTAPGEFGALIEYRMTAQAIAPVDLMTPNPIDRPYAGAVSLGVHSHINRSGTEVSLGADLVIIGPQSGIDSLQESVHEAFDSNPLSSAVLDNQIPNTIRPTVVAEVARSYDLGGRASVRPFAEARAGDESLLRVGADLTFGALGRGDLLVRDPVSGQRYRVVTQPERGFSFTLGGDIAYVADSVYLPSSRGYELSDHRDRLRAGVHWQGPRAGIFFGVSYLAEEFAAQPEGQTIGSLQIELTF